MTCSDDLNLIIENLRNEISGLQAALHISREAEKTAKERLSTVSEQLVGAHQEIDRLRDQISGLQARNMGPEF